MASGKVHDQWVVWVSCGLIGVAATQAFGQLIQSKTIPSVALQTGSIAFGCLLGGLWLSPDLDLPVSNVSRRWGFLSVLWIPYEVLFKHRSFWSHGILIGATIRFIYVLTLIILGLATIDAVLLKQPILANGLVEYFITTITSHTDLFWCFFIGLNVADIIHIFLDHTVKNRSDSDAVSRGIDKGD